MQFRPLHHNFKLPTRATNGSGAYDIYMPEAGKIYSHMVTYYKLGFAAHVPDNHVALLLPRSGVGFKHGVELNNSVGVIDSDFRHEWQAALRLKSRGDYQFEAGDRILQMLIVPVATVEPVLVDTLTETSRNGGFGSTGA